MHTVDTVHVVLTLVERHWKAVAAHSARCVSERYNTFQTNGYGMRCYDLATSTPVSITVAWDLQHATPPTDTRKPVDYYKKQTLAYRRPCHRTREQSASYRYRIPAL